MKPFAKNPLRFTFYVSRFTSHVLRFTFHVFLLLLIFATANTALAQQPTPSDDEVNIIAKQLYCPVCENTPLDVCPTQACVQWRKLIRQMLAEGKSADTINQYFVEQYGARVLAEPPRTGLNWLIYLLPPLAFLAGAYILYRAFRSWRALDKQPAGAEEAETPAAEDEYVTRLEEELKKRQ
ncbi:MAG: cytochrome c-type biogenesis protein CcmH [Anaerolineales bacterium]|nr:cytochrome c-type biogenesis protein CcmH [Anaerolineales bacterium]